MSPGTPFTETGRSVIRAEADALALLSDALGESFDAAIEMLMQTEGRVIVSGMGKSGHIARKIAATFASTGAPAQFVHPAEASHGDLGMITPQDVVIAISNSGEVPELANLLAYVKRRGIRLIGISSRSGSSLMQQADIELLLPSVPEACGTGVVPTVSTTMTLALGDALAVALMRNRSFTSEDFRQYHPGGRLGAILSKVSDLMHTGAAMPLVNRSVPMSDVLLTISQKGFGVAGVTDGDQRLVGIITDGDLRRHMEGLLTHKAEEVMTPDPQTIRSTALAEEAVAIMNARKITCLFVQDDPSPPLGIIHIHDCLRAGIV